MMWVGGLGSLKLVGIVDALKLSVVGSRSYFVVCDVIMCFQDDEMVWVLG